MTCKDRQCCGTGRSNIRVTIIQQSDYIRDRKLNGLAQFICGQTVKGYNARLTILTHRVLQILAVLWPQQLEHTGHHPLAERLDLG
jgi:hypothetical protein